jgi:hypothetical protein
MRDSTATLEGIEARAVDVQIPVSWRSASAFAGYCAMLRLLRILVSLQERHSFDAQPRFPDRYGASGADMVHLVSSPAHECWVGVGLKRNFTEGSLRNETVELDATDFMGDPSFVCNMTNDASQ